MWVLIVLGLVAAVTMELGLQRSKRHGERYEPRHLAAPEPEPVQDFWGSMSLEDEREVLALFGEAERDGTLMLTAPPADPIPWEDLQSDARIEDGPDWREQTAADLAPETLDPGPGQVPSSDPPPGSVPPTRLADTGEIRAARQSWLDAQLEDLYAWVRAQWEAMA